MKWDGFHGFPETATSTWCFPLEFLPGCFSIFKEEALFHATSFQVSDLSQIRTDVSLNPFSAQIIRGEIPSYKLLETEHAVAFLDAFPMREGHVLLVPKKHISCHASRACRVNHHKLLDCCPVQLSLLVFLSELYFGSLAY